MNLNAIKAVCSGGKRARIIRSMFGGQWISNGCAAYLVRGVVIDSPEALVELWNLAVVGTVRDLVHEHVFDYCDDKPDRWACIRTDYEAFFGDSREEAIAAAGIC